MIACHGRKHAPVTPHIETVVIFLEIYKEFWSFEIPGRDTDIVFCLWVVKFRETPIDESELVMIVIYHNIMGLDISMHYSLGMAEIQCLGRGMGEKGSMIAESMAP
jgi:hypothetical protein